MICAVWRIIPRLSLLYLKIGLVIEKRTARRIEEERKGPSPSRVWKAMGNCGAHEFTGRGVWRGLTHSIDHLLNGFNKRWLGRIKSHMQRICDKRRRTDKHRAYVNVRMFWEPEADSISSQHHILSLTQGTIAHCVCFEISLTPRASGAESWSRIAAF